MEKKIGLLEVRGGDFRMFPIPLTNVMHASYSSQALHGSSLRLTQSLLLLCNALPFSLSLLAQVRPFLIDTVVLSEEDLDVDAASADDDMREFLVAKV